MKQGVLFGFLPAVIEYCNSKFPLECHVCSRKYNDFAEYLKITTPVGSGPVTYELGTDFDPVRVISYVNCPCGNTMCLRCDEGLADSKEIFLDAAKSEAKQQQCSLEQVMAQFRQKICNRMLLETHS